MQHHVNRHTKAPLFRCRQPVHGTIERHVEADALEPPPEIRASIQADVIGLTQQTETLARTGRGRLERIVHRVEWHIHDHDPIRLDDPV
jgi:hypothetical protein